MAATIHREEKNAKEEQNTEFVSPAAVEKYIKGVDFPVEREELIHQAESNGAPDNVLNVIKCLSEKQYKSPVDITKELGRAH